MRRPGHVAHGCSAQQQTTALRHLLARTRIDQLTSKQTASVFCPYYSSPFVSLFRAPPCSGLGATRPLGPVLIDSARARPGPIEAIDKVLQLISTLAPRWSSMPCREVWKRSYTDTDTPRRISTPQWASHLATDSLYGLKTLARLVTSPVACNNSVSIISVMV